MKITDFIEENGIQRKFFCKKLNITRQTLHNIAIGRKVSPSLAQKIRENFGFTIDLNVSTSACGHAKKK